MIIKVMALPFLVKTGIIFIYLQKWWKIIQILAQLEIVTMIELYKQKQNQYQNIQNNYPYQDMHLISTEQANYNNVPFNSLKPNPFYMPQNDYISSTYQAEYKPSMMNINKDVNDSYSNQLNSKTLNISTVNNINNNKPIRPYKKSKNPFFVFMLSSVKNP